MWVIIHSLSNKQKKKKKNPPKKGDLNWWFIYTFRKWLLSNKNMHTVHTVRTMF